jgi:hypothetical protein
MDRAIDRLIDTLKNAEWLKNTDLNKADKAKVANDLLRMMPSKHTAEPVLGTLDVVERYVRAIAISPAPAKEETKNAPQATTRPTPSRKR